MIIRYKLHLEFRAYARARVHCIAFLIALRFASLTLRFTGLTGDRDSTPQIVSRTQTTLPITRDKFD